MFAIVGIHVFELDRKHMHMYVYVYVCICMCVCVYVYIYIYIRAYFHTYKHTQKHVDMGTCVCENTRVRKGAGKPLLCVKKPNATCAHMRVKIVHASVVK